MPLTYDRHWLLTWTTYGTWLPGDARGFVSPIPRPSGKWTRENGPGVAYDRDMPDRLEQSRQLLKGPPVFFAVAAGGVVAGSVSRDGLASRLGVVGGGGDAGACSSSGRRAGGSGAGLAVARLQGLWESGFESAVFEAGKWYLVDGGRSKRVKRTEELVVIAVRYVARQEGALVVWVDAGWEWVLGEKSGKR